MQGEDIIRKSAKLRGLRKFDEAIELINDNFSCIDPSIRINAKLEQFYAAEEKGDKVLAKKFAQEIAQEDRNVPCIQKYLP